MLAAAKQAASAATAAPEPTGVIGLDAPLASFKPGTHTWNTDAPPAAKKDAAAAARTASRAAAAAQAPAPGAARPPAAPEARPSAARAGMAGSATASMRSNGACAASFTSSAMTPVSRNEAAAPAHVEKRVSRKAYVALHTSHGDLNIELHADLVPRACENFLLLAARGFYDGVAFHRSIRNFMVQGGDPSGSGSGGASAWGRPFADEFTPKLSHSGRGVVAMANAGPHSNTSQFFILYKSAPHLDNKHTVFGRVVGGADTTLSAIERVPTDAEDRPRERICITGVTVHDDPFLDAGAQCRYARSCAPVAPPLTRKRTHTAHVPVLLRSRDARARGCYHAAIGHGGGGGR
jgi:peptidyl-prolyl cis-trans isomerase-like protein 2